MEKTLKLGNFEELNGKELMNVGGGGVVAFVYALGFIAGTTPLAVCVGAGLVIAGTAACIYGIATH